MQCKSCGAPVTEAKCLYCGNKNPNYSAPDKVQSQETLDSLQTEAPATPIDSHANQYQVYQQDQQHEQNQQQEQDQKREQERAIVMFVLCFFFGIFGVHYFYDRRPGLGLLFLFTWGLFGIGWFVDSIRLLIKMIKAL